MESVDKDGARQDGALYREINFMSTRKNQKPFRDPMREREKQKYEHPVPSREAILALLTEHSELLSFRALAGKLGVEGERDEDALSRRLRAMERDGQILKNRRDLYGVARKMDMVCGRVSGHPDGYGFLISEDKSEDVFLPPREMRQALHGFRTRTGVRSNAQGHSQGSSSRHVSDSSSG